MAGQNIRYVVRVDSNLVEAFRRDEASAEKLESSIAGVNRELRDFAIAAGIGFGGREVVEAINRASDYEMAMLRIKNASNSATEGIRNQLFIKDEVDKFKIDLQDATDAYGNFLVRIRNSGLSDSTKRTLHDEVLTIAKVTGAQNSNMDAAIYDVAKMLGEGVLEARSLRGLERVMPQITQFVAQELGMTRQQLSHAESTGALTKSSIDSRVLLKAIASYADSLKGELPETLTTIRSEITEVHNKWVEFTNDLSLKNKPELKELFDDIKNGIAWLTKHEEGVIEIGKDILKIGGYWITYKTAVWGAKKAIDAYSSIASILSGETATQTKLYQDQSIAATTLADAIERLNYVQNAQNGDFITNAAGVTMANTVGNRYAMTAEEAATATGAGVPAAGLMSATSTITGLIGTAVISVAVVDFIGNAMEKLGLFGGISSTGHKPGWGDYIYKGYGSTEQGLMDWIFPNGFKQGQESELSRRIAKAYTSHANSLDIAIDEKGNITDRKTNIEKNTLTKEQINDIYWASQLYGGISKIHYNSNNQADIPEYIRHSLNPKSFIKGGYYDQHIFSDEELKVLSDFADSSKVFAQYLRGFKYGNGSFLDWIGKHEPDADKKDKTHQPPPKYHTPNDHITGQRIITYNIHIGEVNGQKNGTQVIKGGDKELRQATDNVARSIMNVLNDTQLHDGD